LVNIKILFPHPALLITNKKKKSIVISDLHIGFEDIILNNKANIKSSITKMLNQILILIDKYKSDELIILGDIKYSYKTISSSEYYLIPQFLSKISDKINVKIVKGNHDGNIENILPSNISFERTGFTIDKTYLCHGHTKFPNNLEYVNKIIMGHLHPRYKQKNNLLNGKQVWLIFKTNSRLINSDKININEIIILPSFNTELSNITKPQLYGEIISPIVKNLFSSITNAVILTLSGEIIGGLESIDYVL